MQCKVEGEGGVKVDILRKTGHASSGKDRSGFGPSSGFRIRREHLCERGEQVASAYCGVSEVRNPRPICSGLRGFVTYSSIPASRHLSLSPGVSVAIGVSLTNHCVRCQRDDRCPGDGFLRLELAYQRSRLHATHDRHRHVHLRREPGSRLPPCQSDRLTRITSNGVLASCLRLYFSIAISPLSATSILCPATSSSFTASFWLTRLSSARRMLRTVSLTASPWGT